jgi:multicomponent Na+:H+ antiporter subunit E
LLQALSLGAVLYGLWLLLSGHYQPLLLGLGVASTIVVVLIARRMDLIDREGHPIHLSWRFLLYIPWLGWEIVKANIDIARVIVRPRMAIGPAVLRLKATQKSELGHVIYANSITLTPGTVTIGLEKGVLSVHALTRGAAEGLKSGDMDRRVTAVEGAADGRGEHGV